MTSCRDLMCLEAHEGELVQIEGTFVFPTDPKRKGAHRYTLKLADDTRVVLPKPKNEPAVSMLSVANDGRRVTVRGRVYVNDIPEQYGIIARTPDPYVVEIVDVFVE